MNLDLKLFVGILKTNCTNRGNKIIDDIKKDVKVFSPQQRERYLGAAGALLELGQVIDRSFAETVAAKKTLDEEKEERKATEKEEQEKRIERRGGKRPGAGHPFNKNKPETQQESKPIENTQPTPQPQSQYSSIAPSLAEIPSLKN